MRAAPVVLAISLASAAYGDVAPVDCEAPRAPATDESPAPCGHWYGWQTLTSDAVAIALLPYVATRGGNAAHNSGAIALGAASGAVFFFGAPVIHLIHHDEPAAAKSLLLRLGLPTAGLFLGALVGTAAAQSCAPATGLDNGCQLGREVTGVLIGGGIGVIAASIIDAAWFAREPAPPKAGSVSLMPLILPRSTSASRAGTGLMVAARF